MKPSLKSLHRWITVVPLCFVLVCIPTVFFGQSYAQETVATPEPPAKEVRFQDFLRMPIGPKGVELSETLQQANGQTVRLVGYMVQQEIDSPGRFLLTPRPVQMSQHSDGEADDLPAATVLVLLDDSQQDWTVAHARGLISVQGVLTVGRQEAADGRVSWVRLQLRPDALRFMDSLQRAEDLPNQAHRH